MRLLPLVVFVAGLATLAAAGFFASALTFLAVAPLAAIPTAIAALVLALRPFRPAWQRLPRAGRAGLVAVVAIAIGGAVLFDRLGAANDEPREPALEEVAALPYVDWSPTASDDRSGVVRHDPARTAPGLNLLQSRTLSEAHLVDNDGRTHHTWSAEGTDRWQFAEPLPGGGLLVVGEGGSLYRLDADSRILWSREIGAHHDVARRDDGALLILTHALRIVFRSGLPVPIVDDEIVTLGAGGETLSSLSVWETLGRELDLPTVGEIFLWTLNPTNAWDARSGKLLGPADVLHSNTVELLERDVPGLGRAGSILVCIRELDRIGVVDPATGRWSWSWGPGELSRPHHPTVLPGGNVLVFDNGRRERRSRVLEVDPRTNRIVWRYEDPGFYSPRQGANQRLENGNTLITESDDGRVFEVTPDGEIVWEFLNPVRDEERNKRAVIYRMMRLTDPALLPPHLDEKGGHSTLSRQTERGRKRGHSTFSDAVPQLRSERHVKKK